ncbi:uncharacterized protein [Chelonus insularis]|uniref:uncharacterized protein isoform X2 n=1 Tax=Chelonus insularis TaxID=460826 RepID=UPI00158F50FD|nr:uncharacterized protein LOC118071041 isoform X2 [Chelonus insularis]
MMNGKQMFLYIYLYFIIYFDSVCFGICHRNSSKNSLSAYDIHSLAEEEICHPLRRKLKPLTINTNAIMIRPNNVFDSWTYRTTDLYCKFKIKTEGRRIMAVIQNLSFRQVRGECLDYIKFRRKYHNETGKFCGQFDGSKIDFYSNQQLGRMLTLDVTSEFEGEIETVIFVSKEPLKPSDQPLDITITYTPYRDCTTGFHERLGDISLRHRLPTYCISDTYNCDGYRNCITDYCSDENNCFNDVHNNGTGAKVTVAAVTSPILENNTYSNTNHEPGIISEQPVSSAPMLHVSGVSTALDKDLPPSYESLFPENQNSTSI